MRWPHLTFGFTGRGLYGCSGLRFTKVGGLPPTPSRGVQSHAAASLPPLVAVAETRDPILVARAHLAEKEQCLRENEQEACLPSEGGRVGPG